MISAGRDELNFLEFGNADSTLLLAHGLFGSSTNWRAIARELSTDYRVLVVDLRNHGNSPHRPSMTYQDMAGDLALLISEQVRGKVAVCGHSMGGKAVMTLSLLHPGLVGSLIVLDIAPVVYEDSFTGFLDAMTGLDLSLLTSRAQADRMLEPAIPDSATRQFLLQNLIVQDGRYRWRINLAVLREYMPELAGFPAGLVQGRTYDGGALFIHGELSDYVVPEYHDDIAKYYPLAQISELPGAGHWVHVDQPGQLLARIRAFLANNG